MITIIFIISNFHNLNLMLIFPYNGRNQIQYKLQGTIFTSRLHKISKLKRASSIKWKNPFLVYLHDLWWQSLFYIKKSYAVPLQWVLLEWFWKMKPICSCCVVSLLFSCKYLNSFSLVNLLSANDLRHFWKRSLAHFSTAALFFPGCLFHFNLSLCPCFCRKHMNF